jgi:hypothetical protein
MQLVVDKTGGRGGDGSGGALVSSVRPHRNGVITNEQRLLLLLLLLLPSSSVRFAFQQRLKQSTKQLAFLAERTKSSLRILSALVVNGQVLDPGLHRAVASK